MFRNTLGRSANATRRISCRIRALNTPARDTSTAARGSLDDTPSMHGIVNEIVDGRVSRTAAPSRAITSCVAPALPPTGVAPVVYLLARFVGKLLLAREDMSDRRARLSATRETAAMTLLRARPLRRHSPPLLAG